MSGSIFDQIKKNDLSKKRDKLRFLAALISTNVLVATATYTMFADTPEQIPQKAIKRILHPHHQMIIAPLTLLIARDNNTSELPVTLMDKNKKILILKAYLHEEVKDTTERSASPRFKIEIPEEDVLKLSADDGSPMIAMPELKTEQPKKAVKRRVSKYEINL